MLSFWFATARSGRVPPANAAATTAEGLLPTAKVVSGKVVEVGIAEEIPVPVPVPTLPDSSDSVTGKRSPTKNVAGLPSCARSRICRPL